jgi:membrane protease YdiL (CAAX protease family)
MVDKEGQFMAALAQDRSKDPQLYALRSDDVPRPPRPRKAGVQVLALLLGVAPVYAMSILSHLNKDQPYSLDEVFFYTTVVGSVAIVVLLLLLRFLCGERLRDLNLKRGKWWGDLLGGIALAALTLGAHTLLQAPLNRLLPREPVSGLGAFFQGLADNPWMFAAFIGPVLWVGVAGFEELTRVFLLTRLWTISSMRWWRWFGVFLSAALFGLAHLYQGPAGVVDAAISGLILALCYLIFGRLWPLIIAHYLHDVLQIVMLVVLIHRGVIQF